MQPQPELPPDRHGETEKLIRLRPLNVVPPVVEAEPVNCQFPPVAEAEPVNCQSPSSGQKKIPAHYLP